MIVELVLSVYGSFELRMEASRRFQPQRSGALRKGSTLPSSRSREPTVEDRYDDDDDAGETDEDASVIRRHKGLSLPTSTPGTRNAMICPPPIYDNCLTEDGCCDDSDYDDFTDDDDDDDEVIYENPLALVETVALEKKREDVAREILHTEHTYLEKLAFLRMVKRQLDSMNSVKNIFPPEETSRMFPCIENLFQLHQSIRVSLERTLRSWTQDSSLTSVFISKLPDFKIYADFIKSYPLSMKTMEDWKAKDERFGKLITIFQQHSSVCLISMFDVMHEPYIRPQRMKLLLERYAKCLNEKERELQNVKRIICVFDAILSECEAVLQTADDLETLWKLSDRINGVLEHFANDTRLLKEGAVTEVDPRGKKAFAKQDKKNLHLLLFNNFLLICSPIEAGRKQIINSKVKAPAIKILSCEHLNTKSCDPESSFFLQTPSVARLLVCPSAKEAKEWKETFRDAINQATHRPSFQKQRSIGTVDFSCAPVWIPDDCVNACMLCLEKFTLIKRRHHCRGCGIIICSSCSPGKLQLPYDNFASGRVCRKCYRRAEKNKRELLICSSDQNRDGGVSSGGGETDSPAAQTTFRIDNLAGALEGEEEI